MKPLFALTALALGGLALALPGRSADERQVSIRTPKDGSFSSFYLDDKELARFEHRTNLPRPCFWPLNLPGSSIPITRGWPLIPPEKGEQTDHVHQKSAWFCHGDVIPEGVEIKHKIRNVDGVDFWSEHKGHGKIVTVKSHTGLGEGNRYWLKTENAWQTADGEKILDETRTMHLLLVDGRALIVVDIDLHASVCPITFGDTKEGCFAVRVRDSITEKKKQGMLTNAEGKTGMKEIWGRRSRWCDYSGPVPVSNTGQTKTGGVAIFDHPDNKYPACWHSRDYGLMAANPFGRNRSGFPDVKGQTELAKLARGEHLKLRYGLYTHWGDVKEGKVAETYEAFVKLK
jgi:hypothetical protein